MRGRKSECFVVPRKRGNRPEGPRGGKGAPEHGHVRGKDGGDSGLHNLSTKLERIARRKSRNREPKSRMRQFRTSGSVGASGEQSHEATRPRVAAAREESRSFALSRVRDSSRGSHARE